MSTRSSGSVKASTFDSISLNGVNSEGLVKALDEVARSTTVPRCVKKVLGLLSSQLTLLFEAKDKLISELRSENEPLRQTVATLESKVRLSSTVQENDRSTSVLENNSPSETEIDRGRSVIIGRVPELKDVPIRDRLGHDFENVCKILHFLGVECFLTAVYRLGRPIEGGNRLLKVVLPCSKFRNMAVQRAKHLVFLQLKGVYLRLSISFEERRRHGPGVSKSSMSQPSNESRDMTEPCS
ncbi:unnamed protein product [Nippostrongylus brasiliensis]|uniref:Transposase n=1 Tax=Nippostrongylus brasiliensis TaxID=27835 RepID=A0A0N4YKU8_NIPBR|nr:unnamed protein product [Nippostrongylus brasiliensis]